MGSRTPRSTGGYSFPGITISLSHDTLDHLQPVVTLFAQCDRWDAQADLHAHEVRPLIETLRLALDVLEGRASLVTPEHPAFARVEDFRGEVSS